MPAPLHACPPDTRLRPRARDGFTLLTILIVLIAVMAIVAAIVAPQAATMAQQRRVVRAEKFLVGLTIPRVGLARFQEDVNGKTPLALSQLATPITTADTDICGFFYTTDPNPGGGGGGPGSPKYDVDEWSGRYSTRVYPLTGTPVGIGIARDTLEYEEVGGDARAIIVIDDVPEEEAIMLDQRVDAGGGSTSGTVRWTTADADGIVTVRWIIALDEPCTPPNAVPAASFTFVCTALTCNFTDTSTDSDGTVVSWSWAFGDGATSTLRHPSRTYAPPGGTFDVTLTATDDGGAQGSNTQSVTVRNIVLTGFSSGGGPGRTHNLNWNGALTTVNLFRNNVLFQTGLAANGSFSYTSGNTTHTYRVCEQNTSICSNNLTL